MADRTDLIAILRRATGLVGTLFLAGCAQPNVKYANLRPAPVVSRAHGQDTLHVGSDRTNPNGWTEIKVKTVGDATFVSGYRTNRERSSTVLLPEPHEHGMHPGPVVWVDPDGRGILLTPRD